MHPWRGYFYIAAAALCWGISANLGKAMFSGRSILGLPPVRRLEVQVLSQGRVTIAFFVLAALLLLVRGRRALAMSAGDALRCMMLGVLGVAGANFFYYYAISVSSVSVAIIVQYTAPVWVLLYMVTRGYERATLPRILAVAAAVLGIALVIGIVGEHGVQLVWKGVAASLLAAFSFCFYTIYGRKLLGAHDRWQVIAYALLGTSLFWIVVNPPWKIAAAHYSREQWIFLTVFAFTSMLIPFSFYFAGLRHLDPTRTIVTSCLEPVFTILIAATFLQEHLGWLQILGIVLVLTATVVVQAPPANALPPNKIGQVAEG
ncbi:MAG TPA: DMT family transporter [Terriglobales bacterium]|nr:DMT family transporter [Terriglobales bacterium]